VPKLIDFRPQSSLKCSGFEMKQYIGNSKHAPEAALIACYVHTSLTFIGCQKCNIWPKFILSVALVSKWSNGSVNQKYVESKD